MKKRIIGIDVARALAVFGMILVNFKMVLGQEGTPWLKYIASFFDGKAAATFVVLAGIGLALMTNSAVAKQDLANIRKSRFRILKRALFLFVVGLSYIWIWPADILHFYGIYILLILLFINRPSKYLIIASIVLILIYPFLLFMFDYEKGWEFATFSYPEFWTIEGFFRNLLFNGFHPVIPWTAFMLFGVYYGRQDMNNTRFLKRSLGIGLFSFVLIQFLSYCLIEYISVGNVFEKEEIALIIGTSPMPPMPIYMLNGISISVALISACILLGKKYENSWLIHALNKTGQLALTFYVAHVVLGMGIIELIGNWDYGQYSIQFSVIYALCFSLTCLCFAVVWLKYKKSGPLEWLMRKLTD